jgi:hypothetical protein
MQANSAILPTTYFGNIEYFATLLKYDNIVIEAHEHYVKQTFRNRCVIASANGPLALTVPVHYSNTQKTKTKDVTIDYSRNWQKQHFKAIESAYRKSPFYEFYIDDLMFVFEKQEKYLLDLNDKITDVLFSLVQINKKIYKTQDYHSNHESTTDFREKFDPININFSTKPYQQVFSNKLGFLPNLSILDLMFNEGIECRKYINK